MKKLLVFATIIILFLGCKKEKTHDVSACALAMKERFKDELICVTSPNPMESKLFKGSYNGKTVYFVQTICINCNMIPVTYGYTCDDQKVVFDKLENVKDIKVVYSSCSDSFTE